MKKEDSRREDKLKAKVMKKEDSRRIDKLRSFNKDSEDTNELTDFDRFIFL